MVITAVAVGTRGDVNPLAELGEDFSEYELELVALSRKANPEQKGRIRAYAEGLVGN